MKNYATWGMELEVPPSSDISKLVDVWGDWFRDGNAYEFSIGPYPIGKIDKKVANAFFKYVHDPYTCDDIILCEDVDDDRECVEEHKYSKGCEESKGNHIHYHSSLIKPDREAIPSWLTIREGYQKYYRRLVIQTYGVVYILPTLLLTAWDYYFTLRNSAKHWAGWEPFAKESYESKAHAITINPSWTYKPTTLEIRLSEADPWRAMAFTEILHKILMKGGIIYREEAIEDPPIWYEYGLFDIKSEKIFIPHGFRFFEKGWYTQKKIFVRLIRVLSLSRNTINVLKRVIRNEFSFYVAHEA